MKNELRKFIVENFLFGQSVAFTDDDSLQEKDIIDSTGVLELVAYLEDTWQVKVDDSELLPENLDSVNRLASFIERKLTTETSAAELQAA